MNAQVFGLLVAATIIIAIVGVGAVLLLAVRGHDRARIRRRLNPEAEAVPGFDEAEEAPVLSSIARGGRAIEGVVDSEGESGRLMIQAGWRSTERRLMWYAFQGLLPVVMGALVVAFAVFGEAKNKTMLLLLLAIAAAILSFLLPRWILRGLASSRQQRIKNEVPLFIHLLVLLFEAGLSARQALTSLVREGSGVLPELGRELELVIRQLDAGAETSEALRNLSEAIAVDDLGTVLAVLRQVDRYGGEVREPLLEALDVIEERRSLDLRERVNVMSGRMTVVMVLFFFPALLIFVAGPAFVSVLRALGEISGG